MSGTDPDDDRPDLDTLAGEYVLGVLDEAERRAVRLRARAEPALAAAIAGWERRLAPLAEALPARTPPPALWVRLAESIAVPPADLLDLPAPVAGRRPGRGWGWPVATGLSLALAAGLAAFMLLRPPPGAPAFAVLMPINGTPPAYLAQAAPDGGVILASLSPGAVPGGRDLELWTLPPGAQKVASLGVLPKQGVALRLPAPPRTGTQFLVSLEPAGGSPTGQPTGPVLYQGTFTGPVAGMAL